VRTYREILSLPGTLAFCLAGLLARSGGAMMGIGIVLMIRALYNSYELAGVLSATEALTWAVGTAFLSNWVDRRGQRKVMLPAAIVFAVAMAILIVLSAFHVWPGWLFIPCAVAGFTGGSPGAMVRARWNHAVRDPHLLHTALALESTLDECTWVIGPVLAAALATMVAPEAALVAVIVVGTTGAFIFYGMRATEPPVLPISGADGSGQGKLLLLLPGIWPIVAASVFIGTLFGASDITVVAAAEAWGAKELSGAVLGAIALGSALAGFGYGTRRWKTPLVTRFAIGVPAMAVSGSTMIFTWSPLSLAVAGFIAGFAIAPTLININALMQRIAPAARLTEGLAWIGTSLGIGVSVGSALAGWLIDNVDFRAGFGVSIVAGGLAVAVALLSLSVIRKAAAR
jgi:MFS family permease